MIKGVISKTIILIMPDAFLKLMVFGNNAKTFEMKLVRVTGLSRSSGGPGHCATGGGNGPRWPRDLAGHFRGIS